MQNLEEKLELCQWLYEQGLQPAMYTGSEGHIYFDRGQGSLLMAGAGYIEGDETVDEVSTPWFPFEQVLELLRKIKVPHEGYKQDPCTFVIEGHVMGFAVWDYEYWDYDPKFKILLTGDDSDLYLELLKLLKQVLEHNRGDKQNLIQ